MGITAFAGAAVVICALIMLVRQHRPEMGLTVTVCAGIVLTAVMLDTLVPALEKIGAVITDAGAGDYLSVVLKGLGICLVAGTASDICRDSGQQTMASHVETAGRLAMLAAALPLLSSVLSAAVAIING